MRTAGVDVDDLAVAYDGVTALEGVSLSIEEGEFFTLVGPSGCGKTTLLRSIAGLEKPSAGRIAIDGRDVTDEPTENRNVGMVFQNYALFPHMSVRENVAYGLQFHDLGDGREADERVSELLELVDLASFGDREPTQLSGGQRQRVALARALAPEPDVLLLDEPLSALDAQLRERLRVQIKTLQRELDITTVYVTHDQAEALAISDRIAVVQDGAVEQVATPETVYRDPASPFVAEFVGDNNVFAGEVTRGGSGLDVGGATLPLPSEVDARDGESAALSVRPESISLEGNGGATGGETTLDATVRTTEFLGDAYRVHCLWNDRTVVVKTGATEPPAGDVTLRFDSADATALRNQGEFSRARRRETR
ncbi:ABC transporter ATP-binding protein [Haloarcula nitratireducens]|uniref:ABC-type D-xylose/L-arabinose transporter n=1 Tax=Haloarcula nitratireducens TaxID=2487749 RepID=A0AAW4PEY1_9EURY|nr:ABC transporter ATP-binding protein [Halomicroarcula nitratireducens]MBX0296423.1 ABC transporter ATP-binding protein [Halomicroarcula nitratireducens]